jgi:hypothetical protein
MVVLVFLGGLFTVMGICFLLAALGGKRSGDPEYWVMVTYAIIPLILGIPLLLLAFL